MTQTQSKMFNSIHVIEIRYVPGPNKNDGRFDLHIESMECPFFLGGIVSIPEDQSIYTEVDIPTYDGRPIFDWILQVKKTWLNAQN